MPGGRGATIRICDIEGNWNYKHQDFHLEFRAGRDCHQRSRLEEPRHRPYSARWVSRHWIHGNRRDQPSGEGCDALGRDRRRLHTAGAIMGAAGKLTAGDVILIELQATGPDGKYVAMQYWNESSRRDRRRHREGHHRSRGGGKR